MGAKLLISFLAGVVGFLSPCVLPLLPGYVGYMTGAGAGEQVPLRKALPGTLAFVGGLSLVFISLGAAASAVFQVLNAHRRAIEVAAGLLIIGMGALMAFGGRIPFLMRERRFHMRPGGGPLRTFLLGAAFAFGWTPCIGFTLGAAINLAATSSGLGTGVALLGAYSLGMGVPFVLAGLGLLSFGRRLKSRAATIQAVGGVLLMAVGVLQLTGRLTMLNIWMQGLMTRANLDYWSF
ncbi:MAG TPA: cytochrome c biogenesis CcdA family protein [Actinomycetota bacterium]|nr:cytochrome c biogenesis CcdA family protein [Actinomycetota bacterium]